MHLVNHVQRPYGLVAAAVKFGCSQQHNTSWTVINPPLCTAGTVSTADKPRLAVQRYNHHNTVIALAIAMYPDPAGSCRIALNGKIVEPDTVRQH